MFDDDTRIDKRDQLRGRCRVQEQYLGDSYDAVKRLWQELLAPLAPLFAKGDYIPKELRIDYTRLTGIPMLPDKPLGEFSAVMAAS